MYIALGAGCMERRLSAIGVMTARGADISTTAPADDRRERSTVFWRLGGSRGPPGMEGGGKGGRFALDGDSGSCPPRAEVVRDSGFGFGRGRVRSRLTLDFRPMVEKNPCFFTFPGMGGIARLDADDTRDT